MPIPRSTSALRAVFLLDNTSAGQIESNRLRCPYSPNATDRHHVHRRYTSLAHELQNRMIQMTVSAQQAQIEIGRIPHATCQNAISKGGWIKSLLLFFDDVAILLPGYMSVATSNYFMTTLIIRKSEANDVF